MGHRTLDSMRGFRLNLALFLQCGCLGRNSPCCSPAFYQKSFVIKKMVKWCCPILLAIAVVGNGEESVDCKETVLALKGTGATLHAAPWEHSSASGGFFVEMKSTFRTSWHLKAGSLDTFSVEHARGIFKRPLSSWKRLAFKACVSYPIGCCLCTWLMHAVRQQCTLWPRLP